MVGVCPVPGISEFTHPTCNPRAEPAAAQGGLEAEQEDVLVLVSLELWGLGR